MNTLFNLFLYFVLLTWTITLDAQDSKFSIQLDHGIAKTSHHRIQAPFGGYYIVYSAKKKKEKLAFQMNISLIRRVNTFNRIILGLGYAEYRFYQEGLRYSDDAPGRPEAYSKDYTIQYFNASIGHRFTLDKGQRLQPYLENTMIFDKTFKRQRVGFIYYLGISLKSELGISYAIYQQTRLSFGIFYKSAIYSYGGIVLKEYTKKYQFMPYAYGVELGISKEL